jgi:5-(carboxyamino)imidazole ribonucleotide synthase
VSLQEKNAYLKMYGKKESKPKRKLGHFNVVDADDHESPNALLDRVKEISKSIQIQPIAQ